MNLTIINKTESTKNYLGGLVSVPANDSLTIARELNVIIAGEANFISDILSRDIALDNGTTEELSGETAINLVKFLGGFATDPLATLFLYYSAIVSVRQSGAANVGTVVWAMRNPLASPFSVILERIFLATSFGAATPLTGINTQRYELIRFNTATPSGGTQITPVRASTLAPASGVDVRTLDTGLTTTGVVFEASPFAGLACPEIQGACSLFVRDRMSLKLAPGEGLAIRVNEVAAVEGQGVHGEIVWSLR